MIFSLLILVVFLSAYRLYAILPKRRERKSRPGNLRLDTRTVAVFLGSGGHTSEALTLISSLNFQRYNQRIYIVSDGDNLSAQKALDLEAKCTEHGERNYRILTIPRARKIHQSLLTTPFSSGHSLLACSYHLMLLPLINLKTPFFADALILNGPGTCFILCMAVYFNKFFGLPAPVLIYVETFARVKSLSLSGRLIRPFADFFVTQWSISENGQLCSDHWLV